MSLSGSSASRNSICAITRFARSSSMNVGRKMIRSLNSREKMSNARSPRGVCSTTIGTNAIERPLAMSLPSAVIAACWIRKSSARFSWRMPQPLATGADERELRPALRDRTQRRTGLRAGAGDIRGRPRSTPLRCSCAEGRAASEEHSDLFAVERFALEQRAHQRMELFEVLFEDRPRAMRAVADDAPDLHVDLERGLLAVVLPPRDFPPEENVLLVLAEREGPEFLRHAPLADHLARHLRGLLEIIPGPGRELVQHDLLRGPAAQQDRDPVDEVFPRVVVLVVERQLLGEPEGPAARDDRDLVHGIGAGQEVGDQRVARLVIGDRPLLGVTDDHRPPLDPHQDLVLGVLEVRHLDELLVLSRGEEGGLVDEVREVGPRKAGSAPRQHLQLDVRRQRNPAGVDPEDLLPTLDVGPRHHDLAVEAARPEQCRVQHVRPVRRSDQDDAVVRLEAVHLDEELVQRLLALVMPAAEAGAPAAADRVDLVHENDAGGVLLALRKQVADPGGADADEHLDEVRPRDGEEGRVRLARDRFGEERLAGAGRADQEDALRDLPAELLELLGIPQELDDLAELLFGLVDASDVLKGDLILLLRDAARSRLAEREGLGAHALHLAHEEDPDADEQQHRHPVPSIYSSDRAYAARRRLCLPLIRPIGLLPPAAGIRDAVHR